MPSSTLARGPYQTSAWAHTRPVEGLDFRADGRSNDADAHAQERSAVSLLRGERRDQNWEFTLTIRRVPAAQIEDAVIAQIRTLVQTPEIDPAAGYGLQRREGCRVSNQTPSLPPQLPSTSQ